MAQNGRPLRVNAGRCIGCRACASVCPAGLIMLSDTDHQRTVRFAATCAEDCERCAIACPTGAISLGEPAPGVQVGETRLEFKLQACICCGRPVATVEMLSRLRSVIPTAIQTDMENRAWLDLCPSCRQQMEARRIAQEGLMSRQPR